MTTMLPQPETMKLTPTTQAQDMTIKDLEATLGEHFNVKGRARMHLQVWAERMFESQPVMSHGQGYPFAIKEAIPLITKVGTKPEKFKITPGYWNRRNIKQSWLCSDFPEAVIPKQRKLFF